MLNPARDAAFRLLRSVDRKNIWTGNAAERLPDELNDYRDRSLAMNIFLGTVQNIILIDYILSIYCSRNPEKMDRDLRCILETGLYQLLFLERVPGSAVVNEAVNLAKQYCPKAAGLVNAVLRRAAGSASGVISELSGKPFCEYLSIRYSCSLSFAGRLVDEYGADSAERYLAASFSEPGLCLRINTLKISGDDYKLLLKRNGIMFSDSKLVPDTVLVDGGRVEELPGYTEGLFFVQDEAAALVTKAAGISEGMKILDCCASPGGKSFSACIALNNKGELLSCDISDKKTAVILSGAERLGIKNIRCAVKSAKQYDPDLDSTFDAVICDVPCSGYGVLRKKPEIKLKETGSVAGLPSIQLDILRNVSSYVRPGGSLVYSTCTVLKEENENVISSFLNERDNWARADFIAGPVLSSQGMYTLLPDVDGTDGFFIALLKRIS